ncbi:MAG TPA: NUDIX hydrolase [Chryseolinea sp.]|nr:NUDIX hydrolase [Chryseolinea sp.]
MTVGKSKFDRSILIRSLEKYNSAFPEEILFVPQFLELLNHANAFQRQHLPGHITGSSWILDQSRENVLLVHHGTLNRWLQPGGHADGEENVLNVALREAEEETGLTHFKLMHEDIFDLDIHPIPARGNFPNHLHYDIRFLFEADITEKIIVSDESHDVSWLALSQLTTLNNPSLLRMANKVGW